MGLSLGHLLIILVIVLVLFGAGKLPQMMADIGKGMKAFKDGVKDEENGKNKPESSPTIEDAMNQKPKISAKKKATPKKKVVLEDKSKEKGVKPKESTKTKIVAKKQPVKSSAAKVVAKKSSTKSNKE